MRRTLREREVEMKGRGGGDEGKRRRR